MNPAHDRETPLTRRQARAVVHRHVQQASRTSGPETVRMPSLGSFLRQVRENIIIARTGRSLPRERAAQRIGLSVYYLSQVETGVRTPTADALRLVAEGYQLTADQAAYLHTLRDPPQPLPETLCTPTEDLRTLTDRLTDFDSGGIVAAYFDPLWNLIAANPSFARAFPGMDEPGRNWVSWHFSDSGRHHLHNWDAESALMAALLKPGLARHRESDSAHRLLDRLRTRSGFAAAWNTTTVLHSRHHTAATLLHHGSHRVQLQPEIVVAETPPSRRLLYLGSPQPVIARWENTAPHNLTGHANCATGDGSETPGGCAGMRHDGALPS